MAEINWEKTVDGIQARLVHDYKTQPTFGALKKIIISKLWDVNLISADFGNGTRLFYPSVTLLLDKGREMEFVGLYQAEDSNTVELFDICLRFCRWNGRLDLEKLNLSSNKAKYIKNSEGMESKALFISSNKSPQIVKAIQAAIHLVKEGSITEIRESTDHSPPWEYIMYMVGDEVSEFKIAYTCFVQKNNKIEKWIAEWYSLLINLIDMGGEMATIDKYCISYKASLWEMFNRLSN